MDTRAECRAKQCDRKVKALGLCNAHHQRWLTEGDIDEDRPLGVRRHRSATQAWESGLPRPLPGANECWPWQGTIFAVGYGAVGLQGKRHYAHRLAYELAHGVQLASDQQVRHSCDNRRCVNPAHLSIGTFYDNMQDAVERNRFKHNEEHWNAIVTADDVREIRRLVAGGLYHRQVAERFGISRSAVTNIVNRKTWRQVA